MTIAYRSMLDEDRMFVIANWSSSFKHAHAAGMIHTDDWATVMHAQIGRVLDRPDARTIVAFENTDPAFTYGFICGDTAAGRTPTVFYVYVKEAFRKAFYARGLFAELGVDPTKPFDYVCKTAMVARLAMKIPHARWNPDIARFTERAERNTRRRNHR